MNYWISTDTHLGHDKMVYQFKAREEGFEEKIFTGLLNNVKKNDLFIHLGDVAFSDHIFWHERLSKIGFRRWLVLGNHDRHKSIKWYLEHGWDFVSNTFNMKMYNHDILFSHVPKCGKRNTYTINIHGHFHDTDHRKHEPQYTEIENDRQYLLALEYNNYQPYNLRTIINDFEKKKRQK